MPPVKLLRKLGFNYILSKFECITDENLIGIRSILSSKPYYDRLVSSMDLAGVVDDGKYRSSINYARTKYYNNII